MSLPNHVRATIDSALMHAGARLLLPESAIELLRALALIQVDRDAAEAARLADAHARGGVLPWDGADDYSSATSGFAVRSLLNWGLIQVVGQGKGDPIVPGAAALRLTHAGRTACGLAPRVVGEQLPEAERWEILHGASREALLGSANPVVLIHCTGLAADDLPRLLGQLAIAIVEGEPVAVDACGPENLTERALLEQLLLHTPQARGRRMLLVHDPSGLRWAASRVSARLRWVEPHPDAGRVGALLDTRISAQLRAGDSEAKTADLCGVPFFELAVPRRVSTTWEDVLVPPSEQRQLTLASAHARYRLSAANCGQRGGYRLLLSGLPGTGKTLAAGALATSLDRPIIQLDLSNVLSKWLGETEQHLARVFDVAESSGSVLVLDEAEALLRQRDSRQGGGLALSTAVGYLLTRLDRFDGVLIATTNRVRDIEEAFFRRFDDYICLPIPDAPTRRLLWAKALSNAAGVDFDHIADQFPITGGLIVGAAVRALAWAEALNRPLSTTLALASLSRELEKSDRSSLGALSGPLGNDVRALLDGLHVQEV